MKFIIHVLDVCMYVTTITISGRSNEEGRMGKQQAGVESIVLSFFVLYFFVLYIFFFVLFPFYSFPFVLFF